MHQQDSNETTPSEGSQQHPLPLRVERRHDDAPLIPVRILNEYTYCPRLAYLEWVQKEWRDTADTVEGRHVHRRVDRPSGKLPDPEQQDEELTRQIRSVELSSPALDLTGKIDLLEVRDNKVTPVDYKRSKRPHVSRQVYDPERVQLCAQGLLLEAHGYECTEGVIYFSGSRERVTVSFDDELRQQTIEAARELRTLVECGQIPPPLEDSPKCPKCSLVSICLPDETNLLRDHSESVRPLSVNQTRSVPIYVQANGAKVAKSGERLAITIDDSDPTHARLSEVSQLVLMGNVYVTTPTLHELMKRQIPVSWHSYGGWFIGHTIGTGHNNVELRSAQYAGSFDEQVCLKLARGWVRAKIRNCRTLLRRNRREPDAEILDSALNDLSRLANQANRARNTGTLLGIEGAAAAKYFQAFSCMLKDTKNGEIAFDVSGRNRRPPTDPVNALLSFGYAMLTRTFTTTLSATGFDAYRGFYHRPRFGRPALTLDMMEPFRPLIIDSTVVTVINNGEIQPDHFIRTPVGTNLTPAGRKAFIAAFERPMEQEVTHPVFGYKVDYRRLLELQSRLLGRFLLGEIPEYPDFTTR
ncbi:MAG: CRISPR-associated endonuclease Cas1 [Pseudomonadota bacterium]